MGTSQQNRGGAHPSVNLFLFVCLFFFSASPFFHAGSITLNASWPQATRGSGGPHIKVTGMLVVSLRDVNCGFWSHSA